MTPRRILLDESKWSLVGEARGEAQKSTGASRCARLGQWDSDKTPPHQSLPSGRSQLTFKGRTWISQHDGSFQAENTGPAAGALEFSPPRTAAAQEGATLTLTSKVLACAMTIFNSNQTTHMCSNLGCVSVEFDFFQHEAPS